MKLNFVEYCKWLETREERFNQWSRKNFPEGIPKDPETRGLTQGLEEIGPGLFQNTDGVRFQLTFPNGRKRLTRII